MNNEEDHVELVRKAQLGDKESLDVLAEVAGRRLHEFVLRLTLQEDLTQDIVQESILEMYKVFEKLKRAERFWSWLYGIAYNKVRRQRGRQLRHKTISLSQVGRELAGKDGQSGLAGVVSQELKQIVLRAMQELEPRQRDVLTMRCYNQMPYSEIAKLMGCTEFGVQALFYRAKKSLAKKLSRHGLGKGYLLMALILFGKITAKSEAAAANVSVTAATVKVGMAASLAAMATSKTAIVPIAAAGVIAVGTVATVPGTNKTDMATQEYGAQSLFDAPRPSKANRTMEECWYFFPDGADGSVMVRLIRLDASGKQSYCQNLQNHHANYYSDKGTIYINNFRMHNPDLSVKRLPTDDKSLSEFISHVERRPCDMEHVSSRSRGLLVITKRGGEQGNRIWRIERHGNVLEEEYFQTDWPEDTKIVDNRDAMHKRGWTYFRISGQIKGEEVRGAGRMPFVYAASKRHYPWLKLQVGSRLKVVDNGAEASISRGSDGPTTRYEGGGFFVGLGRPWMGLHTIDTVRRDAAQQRLWFETRPAAEQGKVQVVLTHEQVKLVYTIDMGEDVIDKIALLTRDNPQGEVIFSYMQEVGQDTGEFAAPRREISGRRWGGQPGVMWLMKLVSDH